MEEKLKTTVYLDASDYRRLKELAREEGSSAADQIREAISAYVANRQPKRLPASLAAGTSGKGNLSEKAETLLRGLGQR